MKKIIFLISIVVILTNTISISSSCCQALNNDGFSTILKGIESSMQMGISEGPNWISTMKIEKSMEYPYKYNMYEDTTSDFTNDTSSTTQEYRKSIHPWQVSFQGGYASTLLEAEDYFNHGYSIGLALAYYFLADFSINGIVNLNGYTNHSQLVRASNRYQVNINLMGQYRFFNRGVFYTVIKSGPGVYLSSGGWQSTLR